MSTNARAAIVGFGDAYAEQDRPEASLPLAAEATVTAVEDANLSQDEVDGLLTGRRPSSDMRPQWNNTLASYLGIKPRYSTEVTFHSGGALAMVEHAASAVREGLVENVICAHAESVAGLGAAVPLVDPIVIEDYAKFVTAMDQHPEFEYPYGAIMPAFFAMAARRQVRELGHTLEDFARISVICREWGRHHPHATLGNKGPIDIDDVMTSRRIATPLRLLHVPPIGPPGYGAACVVTSVERAAELTEDWVEIRGYGSRAMHEHVVSRMNSRQWGERGNLIDTGLAEVAERAFEMADVRPKDVDLIETGVTFANKPLVELEELGLCGRGQAGQLVADGHLDPETGSTAFCTDGAALTGGQPGVATYMSRLAEAIRQLRGDALGRQVSVADTALVYAGSGPLYACNSVLILGKSGGST